MSQPSIKLLAALAALVWTGPAFAQDGAACLNDIKRHCAGLNPGGGRILKCLERNEAVISGGCKASIQAAGGFDGPLKACGEDGDRLCPGARGGALKACLAEQAEALSPTCRDGLTQLPAAN